MKISKIIYPLSLLVCLGAVASPSSRENEEALAKFEQTAVGGDSAGGGDAVICYRGPIGLAELLQQAREVYLADTFEIARNGGLSKLSQVSDADILKGVVDYLNNRQPPLGDDFLKAYKNLTFKQVKKVKELQDDDLNIEVFRCHKEQLAVQDLKTNTVFYNGYLADEIGNIEGRLLKIHETLVNLKHSLNASNEARKELASIVTNDLFTDLLKAEREKIDQLKQHLTPVQREHTGSWRAVGSIIYLEYTQSIGLFDDKNVAYRRSKIEKTNWNMIPRDELVILSESPFINRVDTFKTISSLEIDFYKLLHTSFTHEDFVAAWEKSATLADLQFNIWNAIIFESDNYVVTP